MVFQHIKEELDGIRDSLDCQMRCETNKSEENEYRTCISQEHNDSIGILFFPLY